MEGMLWRFVEGGKHGRAIQDESSTSLLSFKSSSGDGILRAAIIYYNGNKCSVTMSCVFVYAIVPQGLIQAVL
jgi:hypothetical protein